MIKTLYKKKKKKKVKRKHAAATRYSKQLPAVEEATIIL
jgi:hypothetical protein